ncbi:Hypothetical protein A7982_07692 [Minicystis rosea]|nr:Hypothetical protein A7982_07692 [Minicystis rosea]
MSGERSPGAAHAPGAASAIEVIAVAPALAVAFPWRLAGALRVTVVVKATFVIVPEGPMMPAQPDEIVRAEAHHGNSPARSVRLTSDLAPRMPRADVLLTGTACAPEGQPTRWLPVRLALFREHALLDKNIYVYGDDGGAVAFERIPLVYERAHGGLGFAENPLGTGMLELSSKPNLVHPERADQVACFAPIARTWPARRRLVGGADRKALDAPIPEIPEGIDWTYFQAAPVDQRIDSLRGDEWLVLEGMSATQPRLRSRLPSVRARAVVRGLPGTAEPVSIDLVADTLRVDADRMGCSVVWRGDFAVASEEALAGLRVLAGVEMEGLPLVWPSDEEAAPATQAFPSPLSEEVIELDADALVPLSTVTIETPGEVPAAPAPVVPFSPGASTLASGRAATMVLPGERLGDTLAISEILGQGPVSLPFVAPAPPPAWSPAPRIAPASELTISSPPAITPAPAPRAPTLASRAPRPAAVTTAQGIRLDNDTPLALGVMPWGLEPMRDCLAVIVKATCDLIPGDRAALRKQAEPLSYDVFPDGAEERVCTHPADLGLFKVRADVVAIGHAHASGGSATSMDVELRFGHEGNGFHRKIRVFGDRKWSRGKASPEASEPVPFAVMPLSYDRAFGGAGFDANPAGVGLVDRWRHARVLPPLPNLEDPDTLFRLPSQRPAPTCFAPIPLSWKERWSAREERRSPWARFSEDLDWTFYQIAPPAQRLAFLRGDEPFTLVGMHHAHAVLEGTLPGVRPRCFASQGKERFDEVSLWLDTVVLDADAMKMTLVWRGTLPVLDETRPEVKAVHLVMEDLAQEAMSLDAARARFTS